MYHITALPAFKDNYIWCIQSEHDPHLVVVDPGDGELVQQYLQEHQLQLTAILVTHHHWDHVDGIPLLQQHWPEATLYVAAADRHRIKHQTTNCRYLQDGDLIYLLQGLLELTVIATPGHTLHHLCYLARAADQIPALFCGDTLFSAGCGRLFEGSPAQMYQSLRKLNQLDSQTRIFCTHEYTIANIKFAAEVEPDNLAIVEYLEICQQQRELGLPTLPSTLAIERQINPYLRCSDSKLQQHWQQTEAVRLFEFLRKWKDHY